MSRFISLRALLLQATLAATPAAHALGAIYYVDPNTGSNTQAGTSPATAWRTPPGTRNAADTAFNSTTWGSITTTNRVQCGDVILLKGGSTQTSAHGGAWRLDPNYYNTTCTASNPMQLRVASAAEWSGSSGHFTIDGTSITATCRNNCADVRGLVAIESLGGLEVKGLSATQRIVIRNSTSNGVNINSYAPAPQYLVLRWLDIGPSRYVGVAIGGYDQWSIWNSLVHHSGGHGIDMGLHVDRQTDRGALVNVDVYNNGTSGNGFNSDGIYFVATRNVWMLGGSISNEWTNGYNGGSVLHQNLQAATYRVRLRNVVLKNNGRWESLQNGASGCAFGGDCTNTPPHSYSFIFNSVFYGNPGSGVWGPHDSGKQFIWGATFFGNGWRSIGGKGQILYDTCSNGWEVRNSIFKRSAFLSTPVWNWNNCGNPCQYAPQVVSAFNLYDYANSENESFAPFNFAGTQCRGDQFGLGGSATTFATARAQNKMVCPEDRISTAARRYLPRFISTGGSCDSANGNYADCDLRLCTGVNQPVAGCAGASDAIDGGTFFLRANGGGSGTTITVKKGDSRSTTDPEMADPRNFFIAPESFPGAQGDQIQIQGCGVRTVASMTASSITFTGGSCSWADNAGIHLPWNGNAPDIGAFESGGSATTTTTIASPTTTVTTSTTLPPSGPPAAPQLLSVEPL